MNLRRISVRTAIAGASTALVAGALVGATGVSANAADPVSNTYTCANPLGGTFDVPLEVTSNPGTTYPAGVLVPAKAISATAVAHLDAGTTALLNGFSVTKARADDFAFKMGSKSAGVPLAGDVTQDPDSNPATATWNATGKSKAFVTGAPGSVDVMMPGALTFTAQDVPGFGDVPLACELKADTTASKVGTVTLTRQGSKLTVKPVTAKVGKPSKMPVTVASTVKGDLVASGKVSAKIGKKSYSGTVKNGKATIALPKMTKAGRYNVTVSYVATPSVKGSSVKTTLTVKK
ncbi:DUF6801 domain-containing protein [Nocardioides sp.]|uniref:DUF6801 domain-containing protein n=1 Tax=Nocardioides sp. TaxID=35761 RepID=UPI003784A848